MIGQGRVLALVPARGGSKRLPGKNIRMFGGKPMIAWSIEAGLQSKYVDRVVVSTDDKKIATLAEAHGADVPFLRPADLAGDYVSSNDVILHSIKALSALSDDYQFLLLLQPTSPLRTFQHINEAIELLIKKDADAVVSVSEVDHPVEWTNILPEDGRMDCFMDISSKCRSQDFPVRHRINGAIYCIRISSLLKERKIVGCENSYAFKMDRTSSVDIDDKVDFIFAEFLLNEKLSEL